jgi:RND superfamily putative drug exporter
LRTPSAGTAPLAPTDPLARVLRWARWPVLVVWLALIIFLSPFSSALGGKTNDTAQANLPASAASTKVAEIQDAAVQGKPHTDQAAVVFARDGGLTAADARAIAAAHTAVANLVGHVAHANAPGNTEESADGEAALFTVNVTALQADLGAADTSVVGAIRAAVAGPVNQAGDGLPVEVTGAAGVSADSGLGNQNALLLISLTIVVIILLLVYRSPLLWIFPLIGTLGSLIVAKAATDGLAYSGFTVTSISTAILTVLVLDP